jgi:hypothetical protein
VLGKFNILVNLLPSQIIKTFATFVVPSEEEMTVLLKNYEIQQRDIRTYIPFDEYITFNNQINTSLPHLCPFTKFN